MTEDATAFIRRLIGAWDCCGTCAGGVLAARDAEVEKRGRVAALHEAADDLASEGDEDWPTNQATAYDDAAQWLRERADREAFDAALTEVRTDYREALDRLGDE